SGLRVDSVRADGGGLAVRATVDVLGRSLTATGRATVQVERGALVITATRVTVPDLPAGIPAPDGLAGRLSFQVPLSGLPFGLRVTGVHTGDHGVSVSARASHVVLNEKPAGALTGHR
ncbi:MAG TPA: LmeA family phospholipid-binding protein, partial [Mycobacteriales bacterium]|nr:LmeA family phospholipid-binding protein [Mycobacteriales bacterium]